MITIAFALAAVVLIMLITTPDNRGGVEIEVLSPELKRAINDPRNRKFFQSLLSDNNFNGKIVIEPDGLARWEPGRSATREKP